MSIVGETSTRGTVVSTNPKMATWEKNPSV